jgi:hypothetical protein
VFDDTARVEFRELDRDATHEVPGAISTGQKFRHSMLDETLNDLLDVLRF